MSKIQIKTTQNILLAFQPASIGERIEQSYLSFLQRNTSLNTLFIDVSYMDFVNNEDDYQFITALITK